MLWQEQIDSHTLAAIAGIDCHFLLTPVRGLGNDSTIGSIQGRGGGGIHHLIGVKDVVRSRLVFEKISSCYPLDRRYCRWRQRDGVLHAAETILLRAIKWRKRLGAVIKVRGRFPGATQDEPVVVVVRVGHPFPDIASHIVCSVGAHSFIGADGCQCVSWHIALGHDVARVLGGCSHIPLLQDWKVFPDKRRVGGCFEPTDARDGKVCLSFGIVAGDPAGRAWAIRGVAKRRDGFGPGNLAAIANELFFPVFLLLVPTAVDKLLIIAVGHLEAIQIEGGDGERADSADERNDSHPILPGQRHHAGRRWLLNRGSEVHGFLSAQALDQIFSAWV